jgi:hypothetical protein
MPRVRFRQSVVSHMPLLVERGYRLEEKDASDLVVFGKHLIPGVYCMIRFDPKSRFIPPVRWFGVDLARIRLPDFDKISDENGYVPLIAPLRDLLRTYYHLDVFPPGKITWGFTNKQEFYEELTVIQGLLLEYGVKWLEDPTSNIEWIKRSTG